MVAKIAEVEGQRDEKAIAIRLVKRQNVSRPPDLVLAAGLSRHRVLAERHRVALQVGRRRRSDDQALSVKGHGRHPRLGRHPNRTAVRTRELRRRGRRGSLLRGRKV